MGLIVTCDTSLAMHSIAPAAIHTMVVRLTIYSAGQGLSIAKGVRAKF